MSLEALEAKLKEFSTLADENNQLVNEFKNSIQDKLVRENVAKLVKKNITRDRHYDYSDDGRVWRNGNEKTKEIEEEAKHLLAEEKDLNETEKKFLCWLRDHCLTMELSREDLFLVTRINKGINFFCYEMDLKFHVKDVIDNFFINLSIIKHFKEMTSRLTGIDSNMELLKYPFNSTAIAINGSGLNITDERFLVRAMKAAHYEVINIGDLNNILLESIKLYIDLNVEEAYENTYKYFHKNSIKNKFNGVYKTTSPLNDIFNKLSAVAKDICELLEMDYSIPIIGIELSKENFFQQLIDECVDNPDVEKVAFIKGVKPYLKERLDKLSLYKIYFVFGSTIRAFKCIMRNPNAKT